MFYRAVLCVSDQVSLVVAFGHDLKQVDDQARLAACKLWGNDGYTTEQWPAVDVFMAMDREGWCNVKRHTPTTSAYSWLNIQSSFDTEELLKRLA